MYPIGAAANASTATTPHDGLVLRNVLLATLFLGLFGCDWGYPVDAETTTTRVVDGVCPDADNVAERWNDGDGERTEWHPVPVPTLCYYRTTARPYGASISCAGRPERLSDVREKATKHYVPDEQTGEIPTGDDFACADDHLVSVHPVYEETCPDSDALLAIDTRAPWRSCTYHVDYDTTHRPFACGFGGDPLQ